MGFPGVALSATRSSSTMPSAHQFTLRPRIASWWMPALLALVAVVHALEVPTAGVLVFSTILGAVAVFLACRGPMQRVEVREGALTITSPVLPSRLVRIEKIEVLRFHRDFGSTNQRRRPRHVLEIWGGGELLSCLDLKPYTSEGITALCSHLQSSNSAIEMQTMS